MASIVSAVKNRTCPSLPPPNGHTTLTGYAHKPHTCTHVHTTHMHKHPCLYKCTHHSRAYMHVCTTLTQHVCPYEHMLQPAHIIPVTCMFVHMCGEVKVKATHLCLFATPWTVARQAPLSMGFSRQEYWSGLPFPPSEDLPNPGIESRSPTLQADSLPSEPPGKSHKCVSI